MPWYGALSMRLSMLSDLRGERGSAQETIVLPCPRCLRHTRTMMARQSKRSQRAGSAVPKTFVS